eukprot:TRINITY_DN10345_c0_g1_i1.p1 TRINITY_DN10345_c0_g1~~TRINITY_DN10345_c0_g1_i1.p1  ORF type:complete len:496 (-),score=61.57 TRINITY_DN10345_c0_g1_i1:108-1595(-)
MVAMVLGRAVIFLVGVAGSSVVRKQSRFSTQISVGSAGDFHMYDNLKAASFTSALLSVDRTSSASTSTLDLSRTGRTLTVSFTHEGRAMQYDLQEEPRLINHIDEAAFVEEEPDEDALANDTMKAVADDPVRVYKTRKSGGNWASVFVTGSGDMSGLLEDGDHVFDIQPALSHAQGRALLEAAMQQDGHVIERLSRESIRRSILGDGSNTTRNSCRLPQTYQIIVNVYKDSCSNPNGDAWGTIQGLVSHASQCFEREFNAKITIGETRGGIEQCTSGGKRAALDKLTARYATDSAAYHHYFSKQIGGGMAWVGKFCGGRFNAGVGGFSSWRIFAHELGHNLGAGHDGDGIMRPVLNHGQGHFSGNSDQQMCGALRAHQGKCNGKFPIVGPAPPPTPPAASCVPYDNNDVRTEQCYSWCSESKKAGHCPLCKCKGCGFCANHMIDSCAPMPNTQDITREGCYSWCKPGQGNDHCDRCKCKGCAGCKDLQPAAEDDP